MAQGTQVVPKLPGLSTPRVFLMKRQKRLHLGDALHGDADGFASVLTPSAFGRA